MSLTSKQLLHENAVKAVKSALVSRGILVQLMPRSYAAYDMLLDERVRIEVKAARSKHPRGTSKSSNWLFNIHRHNKISTERVDFYVFAIPGFKQFGFKTGLYLVVPANRVTKSTFQLSERSLIVKWAQFANNWQSLVNACQIAGEISPALDGLPVYDDISAETLKGFASGFSFLTSDNIRSLYNLGVKHGVSFSSRRQTDTKYRITIKHSPTMRDGDKFKVAAI